MTTEQKFYDKTGVKFNDYYHKNRTNLIWHLTKLSKNVTEAEDVADEAFVKALDELDQYDPKKSQFNTWLFTIARRMLTHLRRKSSRFNSIDQQYEGTSLAECLVSEEYESTPAEAHATGQKAELVKQAITDLPYKYSLVLTMREIDGLSYQDIADYLDINLSTIKSQIRTGRLLLEKLVMPQFSALEVSL